MKTITYVFVLILLGTGVLIAQSNFHNTHYLDPYNPEYVKGEVLIKFKDETQINKSLKSGVAKTGITTVDILLEPYQIETINKVFKETREQRQRKTARTIRDFKGNEIEVPVLFNIYKLKFDTIWDTKQIIEELQKDKNVEFAEPNYLVYTSEVMENGIIPDSPPVYTPLPSPTGDRDTEPNDPLYQDGSQWYLDAINAPAAWDSVTGDTTQIIAIIDTGVDWNHPDLDDNIWTNWNEIPDNGIDDDNNGYIDDTRSWDYINNDNDPNDDNSHGTHVAGIAAAEGNNGIGICGVAWNTKLMPVKVLQSTGSGNSSDFAQGIEYASENGATVINMSMGSYGESLTVKTALENAYAGTGDGEGSILVAAAGNNCTKLLQEGVPPGNMFPACYSFVIGVQATNQNGGLTDFSNRDPSGPVEYWNQWGYNYEMKAPGAGILSCKQNGSYWTKNGTSMASPILAGAISLMRQNDTTQSGEQIYAKLIQGVYSGVLDIYNSLTIELTPDLYYIDYTIVDTLPGCDNDGRADAGETIQLYYTVKNAGGLADSVWTKIRFGQFEDTTTANIIDSTSYIGSISDYATMTGELDPLIIEIDTDVANNRDIVFEYDILNQDSKYVTSEIIIKVQSGIELSGIYEGLLHLTSDKYYIVTSNTVFDSLIIDPGTTLRINNNVSLNISSFISANGNIDSTILFTSNNEGYWSSIRNVGALNMSFNYCIFEKGGGYGGSIVMNNNSENNFIKDCIFRLNDSYCFNENTNVNSCVFLNNQIFMVGDNRGHFTLENNIIVNNNLGSAPTIYANCSEISKIKRNIAFNNISIDANSIQHDYCFGFTSGCNWGIYHFPPNYYGSIDSAVVESKIYDFFDNSTYPVIMGDSALDIPPAECHGIVWKINIKNTLINKYDNPYNSSTGLGIVGSETLKFDVYFNRAMDTSYTPLLTFGVREPYTQHIVADSASWSADSISWTAYRTIGPETGDGIQIVRVYGARDNEQFEIPIEDSRFEFVIQAASAASIEFNAIAGIGKVELEWPPTPTEDALGYNLYRSYNLTDSTYSDTLLINTELILDTVYTDYNVIPDTTYQYFYKTLGTDMLETDFSKRVTATPFDAANGDANGDIAVNVLDITTIVSYMLNQNPSPFLFDAADVNYDNEINVLDIIGLVQLINGGKSLSIKPLPEFSKQTAYYNIKNNVMRFESKGNVAALQFKLGIKNQEPRAKITASLEKLRIFSMQYGFEFSYGTVGNEIIGILYSMSGKEIPEGTTELFRFEGMDSGDIEITEIFGGDLSGDYVPVLKKGENASIIANEAGLQVNPNPFNNFTQIKYLVPENGIVNLKLFDLTGAEIKSLTNSYHQSGNYNVNWDGTNGRGQLLKPGIYLLQIKVESVSGNNYNEEVKVVFTK